MMPLSEPSGLSKSRGACIARWLVVSRCTRTHAHTYSLTLSHSNLQVFHDGTICSALIICESKPEVSSMPMQVGKSMR